LKTIYTRSREGPCTLHEVPLAAYGIAVKAILFKVGLTGALCRGPSGVFRAWCGVP